MDKDRTTGVGHQVKGAVKQGAGKVTGNERLEAEGVAEKTGGKVQEGVGKGKDAVRDVTDSIKK
ncbi:CsbD family protein [Lichenicoccus sp.]|uniref:CsbD family protein n=1 Tax=Lichenicoccus sp. TaxID=2781899 RepID=UPI003D114F82